MFVQDVAKEGFGFLGMAVAFMAGAVTFGLIYNAMDTIGQAAVTNTVDRIR